MIDLTEEQRQSVLKGNAVCVTVPDLGADCVVLRADVYTRLCSILEGDNEPDMRSVALLIERNMREHDAGDPLLESYQDSGNSV